MNGDGGNEEIDTGLPKPLGGLISSSDSAMEVKLELRELLSTDPLLVASVRLGGRRPFFRGDGRKIRETRRMRVFVGVLVRLRGMGTFSTAANAHAVGPGRRGRGLWIPLVFSFGVVIKERVR